MRRIFHITLLVILLIPCAFRAQVDVKAPHPEPGSEAKKAQEEAKKHNHGAPPGPEADAA